MATEDRTFPRRDFPDGLLRCPEFTGGAKLTSLFATARKRGQSFLDRLRSIAGPSPLAAAGLA